MIQDGLRRFAFVTCFISGGMFACGASALGGDHTIRRKQPDRGTYQPPLLDTSELESVTVTEAARFDQREGTSELVDAPLDPVHAPRQGTESVASAGSLPAPVVLSDDAPANAPVQTVSYEATHNSRPHVAPTQPAVQTCSCESCRSGGGHVPMPPAMSPVVDSSSYYDSGQVFDSGCDAAPGCDSQYCDGSGCDSIGCGPLGRFGLTSDDWFGSVELLLMFRSGDRLPALASDGALDDNTTQIFAGRETVFKDMTAGGRLTVGAWLDNYMDRNIVARGWFAGEQTYGFNANQNTHATLVRPFFNVTDGVDPIDDTRIIATPGEASGELAIRADSNTFGADVSIRQLWYKRQGATVDLLYGYQYMGMDQSLTIADRATALSDGVRPIGSVLATNDDFDIENDFHGGQLGIATHYREGCWSFSSLAKIGFGSIRRRAVLSGSTFTSIDGNNATDPNGILVRSTNAGTHTDNTFGWVPELDFTLGWQKYPCFDVTFGYHIIAMTDALELSGVIDPNLASNLADPAVGAQRPTSNFRHGTFYVQGIHFGLSYIY
ncbi:BBP7 family outer membrane beta-barrel protein [Rhodopirellula sp. JC639]|uniref:BBP7 family outer membrane beta-barrel protein n=1 Tax=Stieleria mannarensis TaxID=2755585 RepID=UPI0016004B4C|nr:BBP7 family outer membrane beta-barrel protein [Rhodopirellula sp. JC639]